MDKIGIIGVPQDLGASRRGVDMGPSAIRVAGLHHKLKKLGYEVIDYGNLHCHDIAEYSQIYHPSNEKLCHLDFVINMCNHLKQAVEVALDNGCFPLILGGDHSIAIGTMAGMKKLHDGKTGILWVDAHGDFNTAETTLTGNIHGMGLATVTDRGDERLTVIGPSPSVLEKNSVLIGARDIDLDEAILLKESEVTVFSMREIDERGMADVARKALQIATKGVDYLHVSFDIDSLDPVEAPGTGTRVQGGLTFREAHLLMEMVYEANILTSFELVEVNPTLDVRNRTAELAVGLIASTLGLKII
ncbi:MAG: arginase [Promethearchaeota archaeon]